MQQREKEAARVCQICKKQKRPSEMIPGELVRGPIVETIQKTHPDWSPAGFICVTDLNEFRARYVQEALERDKGEMSVLEEQVSRSLKEQELLSKNINFEFEHKLTLGERWADALAKHAVGASSSVLGS